MGQTVTFRAFLALALERPGGFLLDAFGSPERPWNKCILLEKLREEATGRREAPTPHGRVTRPSQCPS